MGSLSQVGLEIHIIAPRRRNFPQFYKCVEADLIAMFCEQHGAIPLLNRQREKKWQGLYKYSAKSLARMRHVLQLGKGSKPEWAILPLPASELHERYHTGIAASAMTFR